MKEMKQNMIKCICFFVILVLLLSRFYQVFQYRFEDEDGIEGIQHFYTQKENSIDVICFGSSHMFVDVNTATLWEEYGIAAYDLGGTIQPMWNTYYYMKEALKTQSPKLLVVDCYAATLPAEYAEESGIIKNTFGMKPSKDKWDAIVASSPDHHLDYFLGYPGFHSRYTALNEQDFLYNKGIVDYDTWKGNHMLTETNDFMATLKPENIASITETAPIHEKEEQYLNMIIDLAKERNIPLLLIATPYCIPEIEEKQLNRVAEIADERGVAFINYNYQYDEIGLDFATDFADTHHLNYKGSPKFTRVLAKDMQTMVSLEDHRGESTYSDYDRMSDLYNQAVCDAKLVDAIDLDRYLDLLANKKVNDQSVSGSESLDCDYTLAISMEGVSVDSDAYAILSAYLSNYGVSIVERSGNQCFVLSSKDQKVLFDGNGLEAFNWNKDLNQRYNLTVKKDPAVGDDIGSCNQKVSFIFDKNIYCSETNGIQILVYNNVTESLVEVVEFAVDETKNNTSVKSEILSVLF